MLITNVSQFRSRSVEQHISNLKEYITQFCFYDVKDRDNYPGPKVMRFVPGKAS